VADPLQISKLFRDASLAELESLRGATEIRRYAAGQQIFAEGDEGDGMYVVLSGRVLISARMGGDQKQTLSKAGPGDFFGEMAVLDNAPRSATVTAEEPTEAAFIAREPLLRVLGSSPRLSINLVREFSLKMRDFNRQYIREVIEAERLALVGRFARSIVHDFKNPLNVIGLAAEIVSADFATPEMRRLATDRISKQVSRLSNMINELLDFTRGSQNPVVLAATNYATLMRQWIEEISPEVADKRVMLRCANEPPDISLLLDPTRLWRVFFNLVSNAVDAMPDGGQITLRFEVTPTHVVTEIEDSGRGVAPEVASRLFEPFATFGKATGTGLGLSICRRIIEDHRGQIQLRSEPGRGAIFVFTLPLPQT
jgi:signal transduction histidine kinase